MTQLSYINTKSSNILITGFMTSGKSTVGKYISRQLKYHFIDTDQLIEDTLNMSIADIFLTHGEAFFRKIELKMMNRFLYLEKHVVATGGGMPINPCGMEILRKAGTVVYLEADLNTLFTRLKRNSHRPLINNKQQTNEEWRDYITCLFEERQPQYQQAHLSVPLVNRDSIKTAVAVLDTLGRHGFDNLFFRKPLSSLTTDKHTSTLTKPKARVA